MALVTVGEPGADAALAEWVVRDRAAGLRLFVAEARTLPACARLALGFTLRESVWMGSDPTVRDAKSGWWIEELALSDRGAARHPLTRMLAREEACVDFGALARSLSGLRNVSPVLDESRILALLRDVEATLWFGSRPADAEASTIRARAALVDVLDRSTATWADVDATAAAIAAHRAALRDATTLDAWAAARCAQALCWIECMDGPESMGQVQRWREVWAVWRAVRKAHRGAPANATPGASLGT